jgi:hypothetical protein
MQTEALRSVERSGWNEGDLPGSWCCAVCSVAYIVHHEMIPRVPVGIFCVMLQYRVQRTHGMAIMELAL